MQEVGIKFPLIKKSTKNELLKKQRNADLFFFQNSRNTNFLKMLLATIRFLEKSIGSFRLAYVDYLPVCNVSYLSQKSLQILTTLTAITKAG